MTEYTLHTLAGTLNVSLQDPLLCLYCEEPVALPCANPLVCGPCAHNSTIPRLTLRHLANYARRFRALTNGPG